MKNIKSFNQFVNESWDSSDSYEYGEVSDCCGAEIIHGDICSDCGEHCDAVSDEDEMPSRD